ASETLVWLRLYTYRAHHNRQAVRKTGKMSNLQNSRESGNPVGLDESLNSRFRGNGRNPLLCPAKPFAFPKQSAGR
ncbi:MAG: hypothetical protein L0312_19325, partial [Acidobacteria bacterium]|nr:hypothetical protein [Acidobacteriota bacterium]